MVVAQLGSDRDRDHSVDIDLSICLGVVDLFGGLDPSDNLNHNIVGIPTGIDIGGCEIRTVEIYWGFDLFLLLFCQIVASEEDNY